MSMTTAEITVSRIVLGTAQFGLPYGVANTQGQITSEEGRNILTLAREAGIRTLDTAIAYGDSEAAIGELASADWQVITKLPALPDNSLAAPGEWVEAQLAASCARLKRNTLHGVLLHRPAQLLAPAGDALYRALIDARARGQVEKIGISIYGPEELDALPPAMSFDIVQSPLNVLDRRMFDSGWAGRLRQEGCELHVRSIFLQGLLLMQQDARPARFDPWLPVWQAWHRWLDENRLSALQACVRYALQVPDVTKLVVGVDSAAHLAQILAAADGELPPLPEALSKVAPTLLNPALWPKT